MGDTAKRILCVEDNPDTVELLDFVLGAAGYSVEFASTVQGGLELAQGMRFDLYLLDFRLPDGDGFELCRRIRGFDAYTPVLFYSASVDSHTLERAAECGAQGYIGKPVDPEALERAIAQVLSLA